jgi:hypothetical protein
MKNVLYVFLLMLSLLVTSCEVIGDIFSAGFYAGIFVVIAVIAGLFWLFGRRR